MPTADEVKFHLNRAFSFILMFLVCFMLILLVVIVLIVRAASGASNPSTPTVVPTNTLRSAISAAIKEVMTNNEWDTIYYKWFNESKLYQQPSACLGADTTYPVRSGNLDTVLNSKQLRWGFWMQEPWTVTKTPAYTGCDIDLMKAITARIKDHYSVATLDPVFSDITVTSFFQDMKAKLDANAIDAVLSATTITSARATQVDFTCPYFSTMVGLLRTNREPQIKVTAVESLNSSSITVVTLKGSTLEQYVIDHAPAAKLTTVSTAAEFFAQAESSAVHVAVMDKSPLQYYLATRGKQSCTGCSLVDLRVTTGDHYGVMTKKI